MAASIDSRFAGAQSQTTDVDLQKLLRIAWRRKWFGILPAALILAGVIALAFMLPEKYQSSATIFVEEQDIPEDLVPSLINDYVDRRLDILTRTVLLRSNLEELIDRYELYPDARETMPPAALIDRLREDIDVVLVSTEVTDPRSGRSGKTTVAFEVSFTYGDAEIARRVTNDVVSLFLATNLEERRDAAEQTTAFFASERASIEARIAQIEDRFTTFQTENRLLLPDETAFSRTMVANLEEQLSVIERDIRALKEREGFLTTQLALTDEFLSVNGLRGAVTPESQLEVSRAELATARARYSPSHPDVVRLQREVRALETAVGQRSGGGGAALAEQEAALAAELGALRERYTADHPDVVRLQRELAAVRTAVADVPTTPIGGVERNPVFVQLKAQLNSVQTELLSLEQQRAEVQAERIELQERLARAPAVEREYTRLNRELENAILDREIIADKEATAQLGRALETEAVGERLSLAEPPTTPLSPISPNKTLIMLVGFLMATGVGGGSMFLAELFDRSIRSADDLARLINDSPLVVIPTIVTADDRKRIWTMRIAGAAIVGIVAVGSLLWLNHAVGPLDVLRFDMQNRVGAWWSTVFSADVDGIGRES